MDDRVIVAISIKPEILEVFQDMAKVSGVSLSRCIGDWCSDTHEGAVFVTQKMVELNAARARVIQDVHKHGLGIWQQAQNIVRSVEESGRELRSRKRAQSAPERNTPIL
jgi:hypothetical protein